MHISILKIKGDGMLKIKELYSGYNGVDIIKNVNLQVDKGEILFYYQNSVFIPLELLVDLSGDSDSCVKKYLPEILPKCGIQYRFLGSVENLRDVSSY